MRGNGCGKSVEPFAGNGLRDGEVFLHELVAGFVERDVFSFDMLNSLLKLLESWDHSSARYGLFFQSVFQVSQGNLVAVRSL